MILDLRPRASVVPFQLNPDGLAGGMPLSDVFPVFFSPALLGVTVEGSDERLPHLEDVLLLGTG